MDTWRLNMIRTGNKYKLSIIILLGLVYSSYIFCLYINQQIDSDYSNLVLEANDIIHGNLFLRNWNLTGISFVTTDLLYFIFGALFFGISVKTYIVAITLMFLAISFSSLCLSVDKFRSISWRELLVFSLFAGLPSFWLLSCARAHTGGIILCLIALYYTNKIREEEGGRYSVIITMICLTMGLMGDAICLIIITLPVVIECLYTIVLKRNNDSNKTKLILLIYGLSALLGSVLDKLYFKVGGANKNDFLGSRHFIPIKKIGDKMSLYLEALLNITNTNFFDKTILSVDTIIICMRFLVLLFVLFIMGKNIYDFLTGKKNDFISTILSLGVAFMSLIFIFTDISIDMSSARYIAYFPFAFIVLLNRWVMKFNFSGANIGKRNEKIKYVLYPVVAIAVLNMAFTKILPLSNFKIPRSTQTELSEFLLENNLENGYSGFWNSSAITVSSNNQVKIRAICNNDNRLEKYNWFCKDDWYSVPTNFILIGEFDEWYGISEENIINCLGTPKERLEYNDYTILIYDYDISNKLS